MKKALVTCMALLLLAVSPVAVFAAGQTYALPDLYLEMEIPDDLIAFTRDTPDDDPLYTEYGVDGEALQTNFLRNDIYLLSISKDYSCQIAVYMKEDEDTTQVFDFNQLSDSELEDFGAEMLKASATEGGEMDFNGVYKHSTVPFVEISYRNAGQENYSFYYITVYNGQMIMIVLTPIKDAASNAMLRNLEKIVDSIEFTTTLENPNPRAGGATTALGTFVAVVIIAAVIVLIVVLARRSAKRNAPPTPVYPAMGGMYPPAPGAYQPGAPGMYPQQQGAYYPPYGQQQLPGAYPRQPYAANPQQAAGMYPAPQYGGAQPPPAPQAMGVNPALPVSTYGGGGAYTPQQPPATVAPAPQTMGANPVPPVSTYGSGVVYALQPPPPVAPAPQIMGANPAPSASTYGSGGAHAPQQPPATVAPAPQTVGANPIPPVSTYGSGEVYTPQQPPAPVAPAPQTMGTNPASSASTYGSGGAYAPQQPPATVAPAPQTVDANPAPPAPTYGSGGVYTPQQPPEPPQASEAPSAPEAPGSGFSI